METLKILSDPGALAHFQAGARDWEAGRLNEFEDVKKRMKAKV